MIWLSLLFITIGICFTAVLFFGAPYLPTRRAQIDAALQLAKLKRGETLLELGCGDGRVLIAAAQKGIKSVGYELNPVLFLVAWFRTRRYRNYARVIWGDFWRKDWPEHQAIFTFLLPKLMPKLNKKIIQSKHKPVKLVSYAFEVPDRSADAEKAGVFLYFYK
jgi:16S rRNA A1518/A1519 N6-dimethyltransferase RsmA/KsgA/DIM1 with predicted DNA glycosylase/AP lyase activity